MLTQFVTIGILMLFSVMLPGPDFALVTKNTFLHSRRSGLFTSLGIGAAILVHMTYCALGLAFIIVNSLMLFNIIKYIGSVYLIYLGITSLLSKLPEHCVSPNREIKKSEISNLISFRQGFFCNLLNPKATLFFLALFTIIIKPGTPNYWVIIYAIEMYFIITAWFCSLTLILSHRRIMGLLTKSEKYISKLSGASLLGFGIALAFVKK
jgi:RhtB (resistance to homoserine/threonine) family protein